MTDKQLWVDKYRPNTPDEYVWRDDSMKQIVDKFIQEKSIPHLLLTGKPGTGKCLAHSELITIRVTHEYFTTEQLLMLNIIDDTKTESVIIVSIGVMFDALGKSNLPLEELTPIQQGVEIMTKDGFAPVLGLIIKEADVYEYRFEENITLTCSDKHLVFEDGVCKPINEATSADTTFGKVKVLDNEYKGTQRVYDVSIPHPHVYMTPNGLLHHNTSLAYMLLNAIEAVQGDVLYVNASKERKIDDIQQKVTSFVDTFPMGEFKYVILDECLHEDEEIQLAIGKYIKLRDMKDFEPYMVKSINMKYKSIEYKNAMVISRKTDEVFLVTLLDGRTIRATGNHPFLIMVDGVIKERLVRDLIVGTDEVVVTTPVISSSVVVSIDSIGVCDTVNLFVEDNHTFITKNGIATHNCDSISLAAQKLLRAEIENYSDTCRFILTANYKNKIIPALQSRCQSFNIDSLEVDQFKENIINILIKENVRIETEDDVNNLSNYIDNTYPDMRKCLNTLQLHVVDGVLLPANEDSLSAGDYMFDFVKLLDAGQYTEARKLLVAQVSADQYEEVYRWLYQNLEMWGDSDKQDEALLIIRNGLVNHTIVADVEINLSATMVELINLRK